MCHAFVFVLNIYFAVSTTAESYTSLSQDKEKLLFLLIKTQCTMSFPKSACTKL